jgi:hypothetical protein
LDCLPACFGGRLRDAPIVQLYLSPGFSESDVAEAKTDEGKDYYLRRWQGYEPSKSSWMKRRTKVFGDWEKVKDKIALLNIGAYHSTNVKSYASLLALPSSRVSLAWAQSVLFPDAEIGKRIVICMRSAAYWGLDTGRRYGDSLFVPRVNRSGHLLNNVENRQLIKLVQSKI